MKSLAAAAQRGEKSGVRAFLIADMLTCGSPQTRRRSYSSMHNFSVNGKRMCDEPIIIHCRAQSFQSVYALLRSRQCPHFYLRTSQFVALFRSARQVD